MAFTLKNAAKDEKEVLAKLEAAAKNPDLEGVLGVEHEQCVSIDFQTDPRSSIVDAPSTKVVDGKAVQLLSWYDNEWGYAMRVTEMAMKLGKMMK